YLKRGGMVEVDNPSLLPEATAIERIEEPYVRATVVTPTPYVGPMMELCQERRGSFRTLEHQVGERVLLDYDMPLAEIIHDFYDQLKSRSRGYPPLDSEPVRCRPGTLVNA